LDAVETVTSPSFTLCVIPPCGIHSYSRDFEQRAPNILTSILLITTSASEEKHQGGKVWGLNAPTRKTHGAQFGQFGAQASCKRKRNQAIKPVITEGTQLPESHKTGLISQQAKRKLRDCKEKDHISPSIALDKR
jgi:hypothetical protein